MTVNSTGIISTMGDEASGVVAQSLGGGGGNGGLSVAGTFNFASQNNVPVDHRLGRWLRWRRWAGGDVNVTRVGATTTLGILLSAFSRNRSVAAAAMAASASRDRSVARTPAISASVGGFGGPGSNAGT